MAAKGKGRVEEGWTGVWDQQTQSIIHRMHAQQGPTVYTGNYIQYTGSYIQYPVIHLAAKKVEKKAYITEPFC